MPFLPPNQQRQSTEGKIIYNTYITNRHYSPIIIHLHRIFDMLEKFITEVEADTGIPAAGNILHTPQHHKLLHYWQEITASC